MKEGDFVKVFWIENGQQVKDCLYRNAIGTIIKNERSYAYVKIKNRYSKIVIRKFAKRRLRLFCKSLF